MVTSSCSGEMAKKGPRSVFASRTEAAIADGRNIGDWTMALIIAGYWTKFRSAFDLISNRNLTAMLVHYTYHYVWLIITIHIHASQVLAQIFNSANQGALDTVIFRETGNDFSEEIMIYAPFILGIFN